ncbi:hypothetical protein HYQ46_007910 [Verticillium longisporum]|nr:hypothetical protein HYQ46_007910 [Verticillium longisporum]
MWESAFTNNSMRTLLSYGPLYIRIADSLSCWEGKRVVHFIGLVLQGNLERNLRRFWCGSQGGMVSEGCLLMIGDWMTVRGMRRRWTRMIAVAVAFLGVSRPLGVGTPATRRTSRDFVTLPGVEAPAVCCAKLGGEGFLGLAIVPNVAWYKTWKFSNTHIHVCFYGRENSTQRNCWRCGRRRLDNSSRLCRLDARLGRC